MSIKEEPNHRFPSCVVCIRIRLQTAGFKNDDSSTQTFNLLIPPLSKQKSLKIYSACESPMLGSSSLSLDRLYVLAAN